MEYKNINEYLEKNRITRDDIKNHIAKSALLLATDCAHNFEGDAGETEKVAQSVFFLNEIIDKVE